MSLNYNSMKFIDDNTKLKITGYARKTDSGYDSWDDANANADNIMYVIQTSLKTKLRDLRTHSWHICMFMIGTMILL